MSMGVIFILIGVLMVLKAFLPISIPVGKIVMAGFFIYLGITMLIPSWNLGKMGNWDEKHSEAKDEDSVVFGEGTLRPGEVKGSHREFSVVFAKGTIDLSKIKTDRSLDVHVNSVFGTARVLVNPKMSIAYEVTSVLGSTSLPEKSSETPDPKAPVMTLKLNSVFGHIQVLNE
jgi:hypothetical protein